MNLAPFHGGAWTETATINLGELTVSIAERVRSRRIDAGAAQAIATVYADSVDRLIHQVI
jgi:hypothetical protein